MKKVKLQYQAAGLVFLMWSAINCGPEAETGAVFSKYSAHPCAVLVSADTLAPQAAFSAGRDYLTGKFDPATRPDFTAVGSPYTDKPGMLLRREAYTAFQQMWIAAQKDGVTLKIISSTRTFNQQKDIWERKWERFAAEAPNPKSRALKILEYSAMPGTSRHHWGTDVDLNDLNNSTFEPNGAQANAYAWLREHAAEFGFCQPYTAKDKTRPQGYNEERWHWSYMPLAAQLLQEYAQTTTDSVLTGFKGAETAPGLSIVKNYVLGVHQACK